MLETLRSFANCRFSSPVSYRHPGACGQRASSLVMSSVFCLKLVSPLRVGRTGIRPPLRTPRPQRLPSTSSALRPGAPLRAETTAAGIGAATPTIGLPAYGDGPCTANINSATSTPVNDSGRQCPRPSANHSYTVTPPSSRPISPPKLMPRAQFRACVSLPNDRDRRHHCRPRPRKRKSSPQEPTPTEAS